tara:strand:- start:851 stop:1291 length:441 start_codon:yes stop_codon:yes gene_type:complete
MDFAKALFGAYQLEVENEKNEKTSYGIGILYFNTNSTLLFKNEPAKERAFVLSPFIRHYNKSNQKPSSFYQASLRYMNYKGFSSESEKGRKNLIALDFVYGYQFKISNSFFLEPSIGLGALRKLDVKNDYFLVPYSILNFNASIKL